MVNAEQILFRVSEALIEEDMPELLQAAGAVDSNESRVLIAEAGLLMADAARKLHEARRLL